MPHVRDRREFLQITLGTLGSWTLAGCGAGSSPGNAPSTAATIAAGTADTTSTFPTPRSAATFTSLFPTYQLARIRERPESFLSTYNSLGTGMSGAEYLRSKLSASFSSLSDTGCMAMFASKVAFDCAPEGDSVLDPQAATLHQLLTSQRLTCGHYCKLATLLTLLGHPELTPPDPATGTVARPRLHFVVWLDNVPFGTGFHSQLILANVLPNAYLLLDPMYGLAVRIPFVGAGPQASLTVIENAVTMMQTPIASENLVVLDPTGPSSLLELMPALLNGTVGPEYIYHDSVNGSEGWDARIEQIFENFG
jgi:hypothetical protein